ncbi:MAG: histidine phosphatase family protein [Anaerolineaceae bacterium]|nr:histidine phosphatase family protein [Anaerolineaceae bacterium]
MQRVILIRHGETDWNIQRRWQGQAVVPLNKTGLAQAQALATHLQARPVMEIHSSDLSRAWDTASIIGKALGIDPHPDPRWREFSLGIFQGLTRDEIHVKYPVEYAQFERDKWNYTVPNGESRRDLQNRAFSAWQSLLEQATGDEVLVVSHGGTLRLLLERLFKNDPRLDGLHLPNTSMTTLEYTNQSWQMTEAAAMPHWPQES